MMRRNAFTPFRNLRFLTGFTLIELVIVVTILAILAAVAIPAFQNMQKYAKNAATKGVLGAMRQAIRLYRMNEITNRRHPGTPGVSPDNGCPDTELQGPLVMQGGVFPNNPWAKGVVPPGYENVVTYTLPGETRGFLRAEADGWAYNRYTCDIWANTAANGGVNNQNDPNPTENWY